jgi:hypothetical protein
MMYVFDDLPVWAKLVYNTIFIVLFLVMVIKHDLPLSSLPVIGKKFRKNK